MCRLANCQHLENQTKLVEVLAHLNKVFDPPEWREMISDLPAYVAQRIQESKDYKARLKAEETKYFETKVAVDAELRDSESDLSSTHKWGKHVRVVCDSELATIKDGPLKPFFVAIQNLILDEPSEFSFAGEIHISGWVPKGRFELDPHRQFYLAPPLGETARIGRDFTREEILTTLVAAHDIVGAFTLLVPDESMHQQLFGPFNDWFKRWQEMASDAWVPQLRRYLTLLQAEDSNSSRREMITGNDPRQPDPSSPSQLDQLAKRFPQIEMVSGNWVSNKWTAKLLGFKVKTLANRRSKGDKANDEKGTWGVHDEYCFWRKEGRCHPYYYVPLMKEHAGHLRKTSPGIASELLENLP